MEKKSETVHLVISPVFELLCSIFRIHAHEYMLSDERRELLGNPTELNDWVVTMRAKLPKELKKEMSVFFDYESLFGLPLNRFAWEHQVYDDVDAFLMTLEQLDPNELISWFLKTGYIPDVTLDISNPQSVNEYINKSNWPEREKWKITYLYMNAEETKKRYIGLISRIWDYLMDDMPSFLEKQKESIKKIEAYLDQHSRADLVNLFPTQTNTYFTDIEELVIAPSVSYYDCSFTSKASDSYIYVYGIKQPEIQLVNQEHFLDSFKILSDERRIQIIRLLNQGPLYGYELAQRLGLSNSTVSHHVSALSQAGLIKAFRHENRIYYEVQKNEIEKLLEQIKRSLTH